MSKKKEKTEEELLKDHKKWFKFLHVLVGVFLRPVFPLKKYGHTEPFNDGAYIIVGNHLSVLDVIPSAYATDKPVYFMAKKELFEKGIMKKFAEKSQAIPVNRDGNDVRAVMQSMKILKRGGIVNIFPEGTRNKTDDIFLPFKSGAAALSIKTKTPIIPIIQVKKIRPFHKIRAYYGEPFEFTEYYGKKLTQEDIEVCDEILRQKLLDMYLEFKEMLQKKKKRK
ncbi:MAG: 1-acyl-sn-glycerol-3-phosphate acyltransferase [Clostridia bacterium]|nr:1-acyl-sn-glycerol-3-phosphate acyltransferase [Clostridia bacterium]